MEKDYVIVGRVPFKKIAESLGGATHEDGILAVILAPVTKKKSRGKNSKPFVLSVTKIESDKSGSRRINFEGLCLSNNHRFRAVIDTNGGQLSM